MRSAEYKRQRILEVALRAFMAHGPSRVSMEEIARGAGVGKGTVYQLFESKQALLLAAIDYMAGQLDEAAGNVLGNADANPAERLMLFLKAVSGKVAQVRPDVLRELETAFPEAYERIQQARKRIVFSRLTGLLRDGKQFGLYDPQMDETLVAHIVIGAVEHITRAEVLRTLDMPLDRLFQSVISLILRGCLTEAYRNSLTAPAGQPA